MADGIDYKTLYDKGYTRFKVVSGDKLEEATKGTWELIGETAATMGPYIGVSAGFLMGLNAVNAVAEDQQTIENLRVEIKRMQTAHEAYVQEQMDATRARNKLLHEVSALIEANNFDPTRSLNLLREAMK